MVKQKESSGLVLWLTGLPCSGKTTVGRELCKILKSKNLPYKHLDGDIVRKELHSKLGFSKADRNKNVSMVGDLAHSLNDQGNLVVACFVSPYQSSRERNRKKIKKYIEVFINAPVQVCEKRDVKGMYQKARQGKIKNFTGVSDPYEPPLKPELEVRTDRETPRQSAQKIFDYLIANNYLKN